MKNRRQFIRLTALALGGIAIGCGEEGSSGKGRMPDATGMDTGMDRSTEVFFPMYAMPNHSSRRRLRHFGRSSGHGNGPEGDLLEFFGEDLASIYIIGQTYLVDLGERSAQDVADLLSESLSDITEIDDAEAAADALSAWHIAISQTLT